MPGMILLDSLYINNSGGKVLLDYLISQLHNSGLDVFYLLDSRCKGSYPFLSEERTMYLKAGMYNRHKFYKQNKSRFAKVLCFANIPPSIKMTATVYTYFHNVLLVSQPEAYPLKRKLMAMMKGMLIKTLAVHTDCFIVQSEVVKSALQNYINLPDRRILILPFFRHLEVKEKFQEKKKEFIYISNGNPHKNHSTLLEAWRILKNQKGLNIPLHLTVTESYPELIAEIERCRQDGYAITNHHFVDVKELYANYRYSIYPSLTESFGLGLIEAVECETEVLAANRPYVDAVIKPLRKFDPLSAESIADTVEEVFRKSEESFTSQKLVSNQIDKIIALLKDQEKTIHRN